jgi:hypothetical protein
LTRYLLTSAIVIPFISVTLTAGQPSFKNLLISARNDPVVSSQDNKNAAVTKTFIGIPGIENIEFRVRYRLRSE